MFQNGKERNERKPGPPAQWTKYLNHADNFVRWLKGDFVPGARVNLYTSFE